MRVAVPSEPVPRAEPAVPVAPGGRPGRLRKHGRGTDHRDRRWLRRRPARHQHQTGACRGLADTPRARLIPAETDDDDGVVVREDGAGRVQVVRQHDTDSAAPLYIVSISTHHRTRCLGGPHRRETTSSLEEQRAGRRDSPSCRRTVHLLVGRTVRRRSCGRRSRRCRTAPPFCRYIMPPLICLLSQRREKLQQPCKEGNEKYDIGELIMTGWKIIKL